MECYQARLDSFSKSKRVKNPSLTTSSSIKWPHSSSSSSSFVATPHTLAEAGFYFDPTWDDRDNVVCFMCHKELSDWAEDDDPFKIHWDKCRATCVWAIVRCGLMEDVDDNGRYVFPNKTRLPASKSMEKARLGTFTANNWWKHDAVKNHGASSKKMAQAGFVYTPQIATDDRDDTVTCLYCNVSLGGWEPEDDPIEEHRKRAKKSSVPCMFFSGVSDSNNKPSSTATKPKPKPKKSTKPVRSKKAILDSEEEQEELERGKEKEREESEDELELAPVAPVRKGRSTSGTGKAKAVPPAVQAVLNEDGGPVARRVTRGTSRVGSEVGSRAGSEVGAPSDGEGGGARKVSKSKGKKKGKEKKEDVILEEEEEEGGEGVVEKPKEKEKKPRGRTKKTDVVQQPDIEPADAGNAMDVDAEPHAPVPEPELAKSTRAKPKPKAKERAPSKSRSVAAVAESEMESDAPNLKPRSKSKAKVKGKSKSIESESDVPVKSELKPKSKLKTKVAGGRGAKKAVVSDMDVDVNMETQEEGQKMAKGKGKEKKDGRGSIQVVDVSTDDERLPASPAYSDPDNEEKEPIPEDMLPPPSTPPRPALAAFIADTHQILTNGHHQPSPLPPSPQSQPQPFLPPLALLPIPHIVALTESEQEMTVEEWIRHEIEVQYAQLQGDGERRISAFRERADEVRRRIEAL